MVSGRSVEEVPGTDFFRLHVELPSGNEQYIYVREGEDYVVRGWCSKEGSPYFGTREMLFASGDIGRVVLPEERESLDDLVEGDVLRFKGEDVPNDPVTYVGQKYVGKY